MLQKIVQKITVVLLVLFVFTACKDDNMALSQLPSIKITGINSLSAMQVVVGDTLRIKPTIIHSDSSAGTFSCAWYQQTSNSSMKKIFEGPVFIHKVDTIGTVTYHLIATDKATGLAAATSFYVQSSSRSERGWYVLKENTDGNTDMDTFFPLDNTSDLYKDVDILASRSGVLKGAPVSMLYTNSFNWKPAGAAYYQSYISAFIISSKNGILSFRIPDERIMSRNSELMYGDNMEFDNQVLITNPNQSILVSGGKAYEMISGSPGFLPAVAGNYSLLPYATVSSKINWDEYTNTLAFDGKSNSFVEIVTKAASLSYFPNKYFDELSNHISSNNMNGKVFFMENTDKNLHPVNNVIYREGAYALFKETTRNDRAILFGLDLAQIDPNVTSSNGKFSPIVSADTLDYATYPDLGKATLFTLHKNYPILYFAQANHMGSYNIETKLYNESALSLPVGEEITYMKFIDCQYDTYTYNIRNLLVATYNNGTYKIYRYLVEGNVLTQIGSVMSGTGKVKQVIYASPDSYNFQSYMFRYY